MSTRPVVLQDVFDMAKLVFLLIPVYIPNEYQWKHSYECLHQTFSERCSVFLVN